jgi:hypothetical protein
MTKRHALPGMTALAGVGAGFPGSWRQDRIVMAERASTCPATLTHAEWHSPLSPAAHDALCCRGAEIRFSSEAVILAAAAACSRDRQRMDRGRGGSGWLAGSVTPLLTCPQSMSAHERSTVSDTT